MGTMAGPWSARLLLRSLEMLKIRMEQQTENAGSLPDIWLNIPNGQR